MCVPRRRPPQHPPAALPHAHARVREGACGAPAPITRRTRARRAHTASAPAPRAAYNGIGEEGVKELAAALKANKTLTTLVLHRACCTRLIAPPRAAANNINDAAALAAIHSLLEANKARPPASVRPAFASACDPNP